jgi:hypothetical protein
MAKNFRVCTEELNKQLPALKLFGDFDATSACELSDILDGIAKTTDKVAIDTNGLKTICAFGVDVFLPRMNRLSRRQMDIEVTGRHSDAFIEA